MKKGRLSAVSVLSVVLLLNGCTAPATPTPKAVTQSMGSSFDLSEGQAMLAAKLYPVLAAEAGDNTNLFLSPLSLSQGLGLALLGARGQTASEMQALLGRGGVSPDRTRDYTRLLSDTGEDGPTVQIANALWLADTLAIRPDYLASARATYDAVPETLDFAGAPTAAAERINGWVAERTRERIPTIVSPLSLTPDTAAVLTNALYFRGRWEAGFGNAQPGQFTRGDGSKIDVPIMEQIGRFSYRENRDGQAIALPYEGAGGRFVMEVFLPRDPAALRRMERRMRAVDFFAGEQGGSDSFDLSAEPERAVRIELPRFEARFESSVTQALAAAGMATAFDRRRADFSGIAEGVPLAIDDVAHATFLRVDEEGTEAAAVTAVRIVTVSGTRYPDKVPEMIVDRPFLLTIRDRATSAILFFGRIADPTPVSAKDG